MVWKCNFVQCISKTGYLFILLYPANYHVTNRGFQLLHYLQINDTDVLLISLKENFYDRYSAVSSSSFNINKCLRLLMPGIPPTCLSSILRAIVLLIY
jgi:hypothetical protein